MILPIRIFYKNTKCSDKNYTQPLYLDKIMIDNTTVDNRKICVIYKYDE